MKAKVEHPMDGKFTRRQLVQMAQNSAESLIVGAIRGDDTLSQMAYENLMTMVYLAQKCRLDQEH